MALKGDVPNLEGEKIRECLCYDSFVATRVNVKVRFENCDMKTFMSMCDLWGWNIVMRNLW